jgi:hypothetical protein
METREASGPARFFSFCNSSNKRLAFLLHLAEKPSAINYSNADITMP